MNITTDKMRNEKKNTIYIKNFLSIVLFFFFISSVYSLMPTINIDEKGSFTQVGSANKYSIQIDGEINITNPSNISRIYEANIPLQLDSLIGFIVTQSSRNNSDNFDVQYDKIRAYLIDPLETINLQYRIYGIVNYDLEELTYDKSMSVLEYYATSYDLASNVVINLEKTQREGYIYNDDANFTLNSSPSGNTSRLVPAKIRNPTDYDYFIKEMNLYATQAADPFFSEGDLIDSVFNISVSPFGYHEVDFFDYNSNDNSVYWLSSDVVIDYTLSSSIENLGPIEDTSTGGSGGGGSFGAVVDLNDSESILDDFTFQPLIVKKTVDESIIRSGDSFEVTLQVVNVNNYQLGSMILKDLIPENYEIKDVSDSVKIVNGTTLIFDILTINEYDSYFVTYTLVNKDDIRGITYLKPAILEYKENLYYSEGVLLINELLPDKKVFVQKEITFEDDEYARVTIKVKNLGAQVLENILISDIIDENSIIKDISQVFRERGVWQIDSLSAGEEWEVTYLIERNPNLDNLPNVFGVEKSEVFGTLISSEEIVTIFGEQPRTVEKIGMALAVGLLIFYLLF